MRTFLLSLMLMLLFCITTNSFAQTLTFTAQTTVSGLPAASLASGKVIIVLDGLSATDCTIGGGTNLVHCKSNGSVWAVTGFNPASPFPMLVTNTEYSNGTCTTAATIAPANGNVQKITLTAGDTCALTFTQPSSGTFKLQLKIIQSASVSYNGLISGGKWPGGTVPVITATTGAVDFISCYLDGTNTYCVASQNFQ